MLKKFLFKLSFLLFFSLTPLFAFEQITTEKLLNAYLENDSELRKLTIAATKADLNLKSVKIENGFDITLSTGTMTFRVNNDGSVFTVNPSVTASIPSASNLSIKAYGDITVDSENKETLEDASVNISVDIISTNNLSKRIQLMKAERTVKEARKNLQKQALLAETQFYTELKSLLSSTAAIISARTDYYTDKINFEQIKAKGYTTTSSTYMLAQMKVVSDEHGIDTKERNLIHDYIVFYKKCGYDIKILDNEDITAYLPEDIPDVEPLNVLDFDLEKYAEIESCLWTQKINELTRQTNQIFSLSANGGYTFNNSTTKSDTVDGSLQSKIGGVNINAGISIPTNGNNSPVYLLGATVKPSTFKKDKIRDEEIQLDIQQEELNLQEAHNHYETFVVDRQQILNNLLWEKKSNNDSYVMYEKIAKDFDSYYQMGVISESEYLTSKTNETNYKVKLIMNKIDLITYNNNLKVQFVDE